MQTTNELAADDHPFAARVEMRPGTRARHAARQAGRPAVSPQDYETKQAGHKKPHGPGRSKRLTSRPLLVVVPLGLATAVAALPASAAAPSATRRALPSEHSSGTRHLAGDRPAGKTNRIAAAALAGVVRTLGGVFADRPRTRPGAASRPAAQLGRGGRALGLFGPVRGFGDASVPSEPPAGASVVGLATSSCGEGYWALTKAGHIFASGCAHLYGGAKQPLAGGGAAIAADPLHSGYWAVSRDGGVYSFGQAHFYGSLGKTPLSSPVVGIAPTPTGQGYWLATAGGGVYSFGDARFFGSLAPRRPSSPIVGIAAAPHGRGYWLASRGGGVFSFGGARFFGAPDARRSGPGSPYANVVSIASPVAAQGYWLLGTDGRVFSFGKATKAGSLPRGPYVEATALAPTEDGRGYLVASEPAAGLRAADERQPGRQQPSTQPPLRYIGTFMVTCYDLYGPTATGAFAGPASVAVDPSVIALGTRIYVQGVGVRTADDTGGAIIGDHIDIWEPDYAECASWGVQERPVYVLAGG